MKGLDEDLAEAVDKAFYENYKTWKNDHPNASTGQQVNLHIRTIFYPKPDSPVGGELEGSSWGPSNTPGPR